VPYASTNPSEIKLFYKIYDENGSRLQDAILFNADSDQKFAQDVIDDLVEKGLWDENLEQQLESKQLYFKVFREDKDKIPEDAIMLENVRILPNSEIDHGSLGIYESLQNKISWLGSFVPENIKYTAYQLGNTFSQKVSQFENKISQWTEDKLTGLSAYQETPTVEEIDVKVWQKIVEENSVSDGDEDEDVKESTETEKSVLQLSLSTKQSDSSSTSFVESLINCAWNLATYAYENPLKTFALILAASAVANNFRLPKIKFANHHPSITSGISTAVDMATRLAVARIVTNGMNTNTPFNTMIAGMSLWNGVGVGATTPEFQVNTYTIDSQSNSYVTVLKNENFVVAWTSAIQDSSTLGVYGQLFNGTSNEKLGGEFQINTRIADAQVWSTITSLLDGGFVVVWHSANQDGSGYGIYGQRFNSSAVKAGPEFQINTYTTGEQYYPFITNLSNGGFVVTWMSYLQDSSLQGIYGQVFNDTGAKINSEFRANTYITNNQQCHYIISLVNGNFLISWASEGQNGTDWGIYAQRFDQTGLKVGTEFQMKNHSGSCSSITGNLSNGNIAGFWGLLDDNNPSEQTSVYGQLFNGTDFTRLGNEFRVNTYVVNNQLPNCFSSLSDNTFVVLWQSFLQDGSDWGIYGQRFDSQNALKIGTEFRINIYTTGSQDAASIARFQDGRFVVTWESYDQDGSLYGIYGRIFTPPRLINNTLTINEGQTIILTNAMLGAQAPQTLPSVLMITMSNVTHGQFELVSNPGIPIFNFTQELVNLRQVKFAHNGDEFPPAYNVTVKEVVLDTSPDPATVIFTNVNDAPVLTSGTSSLTFTEKGDPVAIARNLTLTDPDSSTATNATITFTNNFAGPEDILTFVDQLGITGFYNPPQLFLTGTATFTDYLIALSNVTYSDTSSNPSLLPRTFSIRINDGELYSSLINRTINIIPVNDPPVLTGGEITSIFTEKGSPIAIAPDITPTDIDSSNLVKATAAIVGNFTMGEDYLGFVNQAGISGAYNSSTGVLTLLGSSSIANYQVVLRNVTFFDTSSNPSLSTRTISFIVNDGLDSNPVFYFVNITPVNDAPTLTDLGATLSFTEKAAPIAIAKNLSIFDPDSPTATNATITFTNNFAGPEDVLAFVDQLGITGFYNPPQFFLTGTAPFTDYLIALGNVTYSNPSSNPSLLPRTFTIRINDGDLDSNPINRTIYIIPVNDPPVLIGGEITSIFTEKGAPIAIAPDITPTDIDSLNLVKATAAIVGNFTTGEDYLGFVNQAGISGVYNSSTGALTLLGSSSIANYQIALRTVTFFDTSSNPSLSTRTISFIVNDGLDSNPVFYFVNLLPVNDAPTLTGSGGTLNFTEKNPPAAIDPGIVVFDVDSPTLSNATVRFISSILPGDMLGFTSQGGILGIYNNMTGTLTLTGFASTANYQTALRNVTFFNPSFNPPTAVRIVEFTVNDGQMNSNSITRSINLTPVNDPPVLAGSGVTTFTEQGAQVPIASDITSSDIDSTNFVSAIAAIVGNFTSGDQLFFVNQAGITGVYNSSTGVLTLNGTSSVANYQIALRNITYATPSKNPSLLTRKISFTVNDGFDSNPVFYFVNINPVNDAPTLTGSGGTLSFTEKNPATIIDPTIAIFDVDSSNLSNATVRFINSVLPEDILSFTAQGGISGTYNNITGILSLTGPSSVVNYQLVLRGVTYFNPSLNISTALRHVSFIVNDGLANSNIINRTINVTPVNDPPVLTLNTLTITAGQTQYLTSAQMLATDPDSPDSSLTFTVSGIQFCRFERGGISTTVFTQQEIKNNQISIVATGGTASAPAYQVSVSDGQYSTPPASASVNFNGGFVPVITVNRLTIKQGETVILTTSQLNAGDPDTPPSGLTFSVSNVRYGKFSIVGSPQEVTTFTLQSLNNGFVQFTQDGSENEPSYDVSVSDGSHATNTQAAVITYINVNQAPIVLNVIPDRLSEKVDQPFSFLVAANTFFDSDPGDQNALVYSATQNGKALPSWIKFDSSTRQFTGTPLAPGKTLFNVIAKDPSNAVGIANFTMDVGALSVIQTPVISLPPDYTIRNAFIGFGISGGGAFLLFLIKYCIKKTSNKKVQQALAANPTDNEKDKQGYEEQVLKPIATYIYDNVAIAGSFESVSKAKVKSFISTVRNLDTELRKNGICYEKLNEADRNIVHTTTVQKLKNIAHPHPEDDTCCSSLLRCSFFRAEITPKEIGKNVANIASAVDSALNESRRNAVTRRISDAPPESVEMKTLPPTADSTSRQPRTTHVKLKKAEDEARLAQEKAAQLEIQLQTLQSTVAMLAKAQTGSNSALLPSPSAEELSTHSVSPLIQESASEKTPAKPKSLRTSRPDRSLPPSTPLPQPEQQPPPQLRM
jgi:hypothetical protein